MTLVIKLHLNFKLANNVIPIKINFYLKIIYILIDFKLFFNRFQVNSSSLRIKLQAKSRQEFLHCLN